MEDWQNKLKRSGRDNALFRLLLTYRTKNAKNNILRFGKNIHQYHYEKTKSICEKYKIQPPQIKYAYLNVIFNYLNDVGFIKTKSLKEIAI